MTRTIAAMVAGLLLWAAVGGLLLLSLRLSWPAYQDVDATKLYTLPMQIARLIVGAAATLAGGALVRRIAGASGRAALAWGIVLLLLNLPVHLQLPVWDQYPGWYHLIYLGYLVPLAWLGSTMVKSR